MRSHRKEEIAAAPLLQRLHRSVRIGDGTHVVNHTEQLNYHLTTVSEADSLSLIQYVWIHFTRVLDNILQCTQTAAEFFSSIHNG